MSLQTGTQLGPYQVQGLIGSGGMGEVYRARDTKLGRDVALKILHEIAAQDRDRLSRFAREAQVLASLNHPNIAAIYGIEESTGGLALVLELVDGETLADRINRGPMPLKETLGIALQIARGLEAAHEKNVIHRDLKPANVKLTSDGTVKVLDFGLAKALEGDSTGSSPNVSQSPTISIGATNAGMILGTAGYMSPEQARGLPVDRRTDIWAFGVVLCEMLSSRQLFVGETIADTLVKVLEREPDWNQLPARMPVALRKLLQRCLTKNPKDRLQAIGDARIVLEDLIADPDAEAVTLDAVGYPLWKKVVPWALVPLALAAGFFLRPPGPPASRVVSQFELPMPANSVLLHNYRRAVELSPSALDLIVAYDWPGNVRQLENMIERIVLLSQGTVVGAADLTTLLQNARRDVPVGLFEDLPTLEEVERRYVEYVLQAVRRNRTRAADVLGIDRRTLYRMAERYGIKLGDDRED